MFSKTETPSSALDTPTLENINGAQESRVVSFVGQTRVSTTCSMRARMQAELDSAHAHSN